MGDRTKCLKVLASFPFQGRSLPSSFLTLSMVPAQSNLPTGSGSTSWSGSGTPSKLNRSRARARPFFSRYL